MRILTRLASVCKTLFRKAALERDLDDELHAAAETLTERYIARGMAPAAARRAAARELGNVHCLKQEVRERRIGAGLDALLLDLRYGWRGLWLSPALTAVVVVTLAVGIGANTAIFSVVHAMLLSPLPYRDSDRLVFVWSDMSRAGYPRWPLTGLELRAIRETSHTCSAFEAIWQSGTVTLGGEGEPEQLRAALVTHDFFNVLGAEPAFGRTFRAADAADGAAPVILLSWDVFERRFGADPSIVGRQIAVNERSTTVVGVMPKNFRLLLPPDSSVPDHLQAWGPFGLNVDRSTNRFLRVIGRMRPGVTAAHVHEDLKTAAQRVSREAGAERAFTAVALQADDVRDIRGPLLALFVGVGILLTIACVNVAGLLIARAASRTRETSLRLALGASRGRLLRQALVEGLLLMLLGAAAGVLLGSVGLRVLIALTPEALSRLTSARIDATVLAFTLAVSVVWGILFSLAPLSELFKVSAGWSLQPGWRYASRVRYRARAALVVVQIALSVVLLVSAGLLVRAFVEVLGVDPGFRTDGQVTFRLSIPGYRYQTRDAFSAFARAVDDKLAAIPGVTGAGAISHIPYDDLPNWGGAFARLTPLPPDSPSADLRAMSAGTFDVLGARLIEGRLFTDADGYGDGRVAIVDEKLAKQLWPGRSAIGQQFAMQGIPRLMTTVVGVVRHLRLRSLVDDLTPQVYVPWPSSQRNPMAYIVRTDRPAADVAPDLRAAVGAVDPRVPIYDIRPMNDYVEGARSTRQFTMLLAAAFAGAALVLTCVGVYGVLAFAVTRRRHEFGVRRALGADAARVLRDVLGEGLVFTAAGSLGGLAGAAIAGKLLHSQLYLVHPRDPLSFAAAFALIVGGSLIACSIPAWRASTISPMDALRND
jgi:predicted permease